MATFPSLAPSAAPITPGAWPVSALNSLNGAESRIRQGSAQIGRRLQLTFANITEANFLAILAHYQGQRSGFDLFGFDAATLAADLTPSGHAWLYASRPQVVDEHLDVFTVVCEFKSEPRGLVVAMAKMWRTGATTLTRGAGFDGARTAAGRQLVTNASTLAPGAGNSGVGSRGVRWATEFTSLASVPPDPYFSSVSLLLHFEGVNGSTTFTDSGPLGLSVVRDATLPAAQITIAQAAVGSSSFAPNSGHLILPTSTALTLAGDFTVEWRARHSFFSSSHQAYFLNGTNYFSYSPVTSPGLFFSPSNVTRTLSMALDTWAALAITRSGSTIYWFKDGALLGSATDSTAYNFSGGRITGGAGSGRSLVGFMDEIRITKGVCRYTASYTVATKAFPDY
jgi:hypothetical protein